MNEENAQQSDAPVETEVKEAPHPTLADVAKKYNVEEEIKNFQPQVQPQVQQPPQYAQPSAVPDPVSDLEGWNKYQAYQNTVIGGALGGRGRSVPGGREN